MSVLPEATYDLDRAVQRTIDELRARLNRHVPDLDKAVRLAISDACAANAGGIPELSRELIREDLVIQLQFPEEFVVYVDHAEPNEAGTRMRREVKHHSRDLDAAYASLVSLAPGEQERATLEYQPDPAA